MNSTMQPETSPATVDLHDDFATGRVHGVVGSRGNTRVRLVCGKRNLWFAISIAETDVAALRVGLNSGTSTHVQPWSKSDGSFGVEWSTELGAMRARLHFTGRETLRCITTLLPSADVTLAEIPRDVVMLGSQGDVHTRQRGLRSGIVFAGGRKPVPFSLFYIQDFSSLSDFFRAAKLTPADTVGGSWPLLGYRIPPGDYRLTAGRDWTLSDAYLTVASEAPASEETIAALYLDLLAESYLALPRPAVTYRPWNERAAHALRDLSLSPLCTYERQGRRFLMPYVGDRTKPPESMVQFTVAANLGEYDRWRGEGSALETMLRDTAASFFNDELETIVRWLPGESFAAGQADDNMSHEAMDSWYLHHALFNLARFASEGDAGAREMFRESLPFIVRVAWRFNYRWPIFFNLKTLDIIRAESTPGAGGETDVAGLYALVLIHAFELFGDPDYLQEAEVALTALHGYGFNLAYQLNTTGFAVEAAMRLFKRTGKRRHLGLAEVCLANLFDNMWLWQCDYGHAHHYPTFFGLFPLRDAPYIAPYEELEAHAKFHELLALGGDDVRPSVRLLVAEFQKYSLHRCWYYYPDTLPADAVSKKPRNGRNERSLSVPLEDLQDGMEESGQVGQELYGAGLPFVMTSRHYMTFADGALLAYSSYPMYDFAPAGDGSATWRAGGDPRASGEVRIIPNDVNGRAHHIVMRTRDGEVRTPVRGEVSPEGHAVFAVRGGQRVEMYDVPGADSDADTLTIGALAAVDTK